MCKRYILRGLQGYIIVNKMFERFKMPRGLIKDQKDIFTREFLKPKPLTI